MLAWVVAVSAMWLLALVVSRTIPAANSDELPRSLLAVLSTFDGEHYGFLARHGYSADGELARLFGHFPLLPLVAGVLGRSWSHEVLAGILVSQLALLGSMLLLGELAHGRAAAPLRLQPGFWLLVTPLSFFFFVMYTESLYLLCTLLMVVAYQRGRASVAAGAGILAGLARANAITLPALFAMDLLRGRDRRAWLRAVIVAMSPLLGVALWLAYAGYRLGDPLGYFEALNRWWRHDWQFPFYPFVRDSWRYALATLDWQLPLRDQILRQASTVAALGLLVWGWRRLDRSHLIYLIVSLAFIHAHDPPINTSRYILALFPLYLLLPQTALARPRIAPLVAAASCALQLRFAIDHFTRHWVS